MKKQRNNKGFSLVEMIVVVLIMGIITVSLAPQVMKWVSKARESADYQAADDIKAMAQIAVAQYRSTGDTLADEEYIVTAAGVELADGGTDANSGLEALFEDYMHGTYPKVQNESGKVFQIEVSAAGKVVVNTVNGTY